MLKHNELNHFLIIVAKPAYWPPRRNQSRTLGEPMVPWNPLEQVPRTHRQCTQLASHESFLAVILPYFIYYGISQKYTIPLGVVCSLRTTHVYTPRTKPQTSKYLLYSIEQTHNGSRCGTSLPSMYRVFRIASFHINVERLLTHINTRWGSLS